MSTEFHNGRVVLHAGNCLDVVRGWPAASIDAVVTDPPYALVSIGKRFGAEGAKASAKGDAYARAAAGFMGKRWDTGEVAFAVEFWAEIYRVLKPGGHVAAFGGTRTIHRLACAIEDAGFEIRDQLQWLYGSGFPKSHDVSKAIDKAAGVERLVVGVAGRSGAARACMAGDFSGGEYAATVPATDGGTEWQGWGTALKPACEPIILGRKALAGTVAANVLTHGTGALNIEACRVGNEVRTSAFTSLAPCSGNRFGASDTAAARRGTQGDPKDYVGRHPANVLHDGALNEDWGRYFYSAKADAQDRVGSKHPTVKPVDLMRWLVRLICPPGGTVLDPFAGTGTTGAAAWHEGFNCHLIEREEEYRGDIARRMDLLTAGPVERAVKTAVARGLADDHGPLFGGEGAPGGAEISRAQLQILCRPGRTIGPLGLRR